MKSGSKTSNQRISGTSCDFYLPASAGLSFSPAGHMLKRTRGIVLKTNPFSEADLIATFFTYDFGIIRVFVKGPRKIKSRFGSSLEPFTYAQISFWGREDAKLPRLTQCDIIYPFQSVREKIRSFLKLSELVELIFHLLPEYEVHQKAFKLLLNALRDAELEAASGLSCIHHKIKLLALMGYAPRLHECARCGKPGNKFYLSEGSVICRECRKDNNASSELSVCATSLYKHLLLWEPSKVNRIKPSESSLEELRVIIDNHIRHIITGPIKTRDFLCRGLATSGK